MPRKRQSLPDGVIRIAIGFANRDKPTIASVATGNTRGRLFGLITHNWASFDEAKGLTPWGITGEIRL